MAVDARRFRFPEATGRMSYRSRPCSRASVHWHSRIARCRPDTSRTQTSQQHQGRALAAKCLHPRPTSQKQRCRCVAIRLNVEALSPSLRLPKVRPSDARNGNVEARGVAAGSALAATCHRLDEQEEDGVARFRPPQRSSTCCTLIQSTLNHCTRVHEISGEKIIRRGRSSLLGPDVVSDL
jgi:hypothetical protein